MQLYDLLITQVSQPANYNRTRNYRHNRTILQDPCPLKDAIRLKILTRLTKEGSSAGEPANIPMTDYSSLSSAGLTSADEVQYFQNLKEWNRSNRILTLQEEDGSKDQNQQPATAKVKQRKMGASKSGTRRERVVGKFGRSYKRVEVTC